MKPPNLRPTLVRGLFAFGEDMVMLQGKASDARSTMPVVACVQMAPHIGAKHDNVVQSIRYIEEAAKNGASLVVLPELCNTGYVFADREEAYAQAEDLAMAGETSSAWVAVAQRLGVHLVAGIVERDGHRLYNSAVFIGPDGIIGIYRKLHLWDREHLIFAPGNSGMPIFDTPFGRIAIAICYDGWFPEMYRLASAQDADLVCVPTNWVPMPGQPANQHAMATTLTMAAAHSNGFMIACANRIGTERGVPFIGQSVIVSGDGWPMAGPASKDQEEILYAPIDLERIRAARTRNTFNHVLRDRRTDVYGTMPDPGSSASHP